MNIKNLLNNMSQKREGFGLILALIVSTIGLVFVALMFGSVSTFSEIFSEYRRGYIAEITASSYIEMAKGQITEANRRRRLNTVPALPVLHGRDIANFRSLFDDDIIQSVDGLLLREDEGFGEAEGFNRLLPPENGLRVRVRVYDMNYRMENININSPSFSTPAGAGFEGLPPSFFMFGEEIFDMMKIGLDGTYEVHDMGDDFRAIFDNYGAYLIRVEVFDASNIDRPIRTTEEAFVQYVPGDALTP